MGEETDAYHWGNWDGTLSLYYRKSITAMLEEQDLLTGGYQAGITASYQHDWAHHTGAGWAAVVMVWLFVIHFGYSWGPCAWIVVSEIWPLSNRPYGIALGASSNW
jgi:hypothetical protein